MKDQSDLKRVVSDVVAEIGKSSKLEMMNYLQPDQDKVALHEVESAECECCGLHEDCTTDYIVLVKECYCGKWVCGLCSEAVKEQLKKDPGKALEEAIATHMAFTKKFNSTTRLNPMLSLAKSMTHAIKISLRHGAASVTTKLPAATKIARRSSCMPRIDHTEIDFEMIRESNRILH